MYAKMVTQGRLYRLGLSVEIKTLVLSQGSRLFFLLGSEIVCVRALPGRRRRAYIECPLPLHCLVVGLNYKTKDSYYYNGKRLSTTAIKNE